MLAAERQALRTPTLNRMDSPGNYVYVLTNPAMPGLVKIGRTDSSDPTTRVTQLYPTGVPVPFEARCLI